MTRTAYHGTNRLSLILEDAAVKSFYSEERFFEELFARYNSLRREIIVAGKKNVGEGFEDDYYLMIGGNEVSTNKVMDFRKYQRELHVWLFIHYDRAERYARPPDPAIFEFNLPDSYEETGSCLIVPKKLDFSNLTAIYVPETEIEVTKEILIGKMFLETKVKKLK